MFYLELWLKIKRPQLENSVGLECDSGSWNGFVGLGVWNLARTSFAPTGGQTSEVSEVYKSTPKKIVCLSEIFLKPGGIF